jgi:hypothetical protein
MMKKAIWLVPILVVLFSCASKPPAQQQGVDLSAAKNRAVAARTKAQSVKAEVAVKEAYTRAQMTFDTAETQEIAGQAAAGETYLEAEKYFLAAFTDADAKRTEAQRQLNLAKDAIKGVESDAAALEQEQRESVN